MAKFKSREEYERWKAERLKGSASQKAGEDSAEPSSPLLERTRYGEEAVTGKQKAAAEAARRVSEHYDADKATGRLSGKISCILSLIFLIALAGGGIYYFSDVYTPEYIFASNKAAVVFIRVFDILGRPLGQGSGFVLGDDGVIATNYHVIKDAAGMEVKTNSAGVLEPEGVLYVDEENDIALIKLRKNDKTPLFKVETGDPDELVVGDKVFALGNPLGQEDTFSDGIVSGLREMPNGVRLLQITAPLSPGSSGGAVLDTKGRVVGISTFLLRDGQNMNFAVPISLIRDVVKTRKDIIYTFPNIEASWSLVDEFHSDDPFFNDVGNIEKSDNYFLYCDPKSIRRVAGEIRGLWAKMAVSETDRTTVYGVGMQDNSTEGTIYAFVEFNCQKNYIRTRAVFASDNKSQVKTETDFSKKNRWEQVREGSPLAKLQAMACQDMPDK